MHIKFLEFGSSLGTRDLGSKIREEIEKSIDRDEKVIFDLKGMEIISNSFADECFAK